MLRKFFAAVSIAFMFYMLSPPAQAESSVSLNTLNWEPYIGERIPYNGFVGALVREAYGIAGYATRFEFMPWVRAKRMAEAGMADGCFPEYYLQEDEETFFISDPFPGGILGFIKRKADPITFTKLEDLKNLKIGVVRGYVNTTEFDKAYYLQKEEADGDLMNLRKLLAGRIDLVVIDKLVGLNLMKQEMAADADKVEFLSPALEEKTLHVLIFKKTIDAELKMRAFNEGLKKLKSSGRLDVLMAESGI